jgi:hypothetical protein
LFAFTADTEISGMVAASLETFELLGKERIYLFSEAGKAVCGILAFNTALVTLAVDGEPAGDQVLADADTLKSDIAAVAVKVVEEVVAA